MKLFSLTTMIIYSLCVACCGGEDDYYNSSYQNLSIINNNLIEIRDDATALNLGETIYIDTILSNEQVTYTNETIYLTDFVSPAYPISYTLVLYKLNIYGNLEEVALNSQSILQIEGESVILFDGLDVSIAVRLIQNDEMDWVNKFGITILESGTYYLGANYYTNNGGAISINTSNMDGNVNISTKIINSNEVGLYEFVVN